jgi:peptide deformylase
MGLLNSDTLRLHTITKDSRFLRRIARKVRSWNHVERYAEAMLILLDELGDGAGLAAPQVGLPFRFFLVSSEYADAFGARMIINPTVRPVRDSGMVSSVERCLSIPGLEFCVARWKVVDVAYQAPGSRERVTVRLQHFPAVLVQHETDHLNGVLIDEVGIGYGL